ncbi:hypothetical protein MJH12_10465, partial [bacterium]|nr:hypothetical protein [bacterium]
PRAVISNVSNFVLTSIPYVISTSRSFYDTQVFDLDCSSGDCLGQISGYIEYESGFLLSRRSTGTDTRTFQQFSFRFADLSLFSPESGEIDKLLGQNITFSTKTNYVYLTTSNVQSSRVSFQGNIVLQDDGIWPLKLDLTDNAKDSYGENNYEAKSLQQMGILYFRKDKTAPQISITSLNQASDDKSGNYQITGTVEDQLSRIMSISINGIAIDTSTFVSFTSTSPWAQYVNLDPYVSVQYSAELTLSSGKSQQIIVSSQDIHGNSTSITRLENVFPLFTKTIQRFDLFTEPVQVGFGGTTLSNVYVADKAALNVREFSVSGDLRKTIVGNQEINTTFFTNIERFDSFDMFYDMNKNLESMLIGGKYSGRNANPNLAEIAHLPKLANIEENQINRPELIGQFVLEDLENLRKNNKIEGDNYHIFRVNDASTEADLFLTNAIVRYTPLLASVVYIAAQTSAGQDLFLRRYVKSFSKNVDPLTNQVYTEASLGGFAKSTGTALDFPSRVSSITLTQVHELNVNLPGGVSFSREYSYMALPDQKSIVRYEFINSSLEISSRFIKKTSWTFANIKANQIEIDRDGKTIYVSDQESLKLYKFSVTSSDTLTIVTDFGGQGFIGGQGFKEGNFRSIDGVRGLIPLNQNNFLNLYVTDSLSRRISVFTTNGTFIKYLADDPYGLGGIEDSALLSEYGDSEWSLLDIKFDAFDVYNSADVAYKRVSASSIGLVSYTTQIKELIFSKEKIVEDTVNLLDTNYFTNSQEIYKTTSSSMYFIESQSNKLFVVKDSTSISFTSILTSVIQGQNAICTSVVPSEAWTDSCTTLPEYVPNVVPNQRVVTQKSSFVRDPRSFLTARDAFGQGGYNLVAADLIEDGDIQRLMILESGGGNDRVQMFSETEIHVSSTNTGQSSGVGICHMDTYLVIAGNVPSNSFSVATYAAGTKKIQNDMFFSSYPIYELDGSTIHSFSNVMDMHCSNDRIAIADSTGVKIFAAPSDPSQGFPMVQFIDTTDDSLSSADPMRTLSGSLDVLIRGSNLFVLEKERKKVHKYQIK